MSVSDQVWAAVQRFLGREALLLDNKDWDGWLALYLPEAEYWLPAWDDQGGLTDDPQTEISLIYYPNRGGLEDRVYRIRTGRSSATSPPMRTCHMFTLLDVEQRDVDLSVSTSWVVHSFRDEETLTYFGRAEYILATEGDELRIARKKTIVLNDISRSLLDIYNV
ncbi:MAG: aromatic-ring-hydroxylating dioxygenase subunit beta [Novosphingobium sp.]|nr:aromatic-ring-hydroxylating dioxygenase subunit beta [Novosphingobium sp.]